MKFLKLGQVGFVYMLSQTKPAESSLEFRSWEGVEDDDRIDEER